MRCHCKLFLGFGLALLSRLHRTWRLRWPLGAVLRHVHFIEVGKEAAFSSPWGSGAATALHSSKAPAAVLNLSACSFQGAVDLKAAHGWEVLWHPPPHPAQTLREHKGGRPSGAAMLWGSTPFAAVQERGDGPLPCSNPTLHRRRRTRPRASCCSTRTWPPSTARSARPPSRCCSCSCAASPARSPALCGRAPAGAQAAATCPMCHRWAWSAAGPQLRWHEHDLCRNASARVRRQCALWGGRDGRDL